jgi:tripartite-type tricarboxylate transporter receptor subunit TctC
MASNNREFHCATTLRALSILVAVALLIGEALAQPFPSKAIRMVVPFTPGGSADIAGRVIAEHLEKAMAQPVIVENRPGGDTAIATEYVVRAAPDGYMLLMVFPSFIINPAIRPSLPFDPLKDFAAVSQIYFVPMVIAVHPSVSAKSFQELVALARSKPGGFSYGASGRMQQVMGEMLKLNAKINVVHVPFQGSAPALNALMGGHIPMLYGNVTEIAPHEKAGKVRALVVTSRERSDVLPGVPTMREAGFPELEAVNWSGIVVPASTPPDIATRLNAEISRALADPQVAERLRKNGLTPTPGTREHFAAFLQSEASRYAKVVREAGIKAN